MLDDFEEAMRLRESADYGLVFSEEGAGNVLESAGSFLDNAKKIPKGKGKARLTRTGQQRFPVKSSLNVLLGKKRYPRRVPVEEVEEKMESRRVPGAQFLDANFFSHARIRDAQV